MNYPETNIGAALANATVINIAPHEHPEPDFSILDQGRRPPPEIPTIVFGEFGPWAEKAAESVSAPIDYVIAGLLAAASSAIGSACAISPWHGWVAPSALWTALVGNASSGKSAPLDLFTATLKEIERDEQDAVKDDRAAHETKRVSARLKKEAWESDIAEALKEGHHPPPLPDDAIDPGRFNLPRAVVSDTTTEELISILSTNSRILVYRDELAGWMGKLDKYNGGGDRALYLEAFEGRLYTVDRRNHSGEPTVVDNLLVSIAGGIQPDKLMSTLLSGDDDGLPARFLFFWPNPVPPKRPTTSTDKQKLKQALVRLRSLKAEKVEGSDRLKPKVIMLSADAATTFQEWRDEHYRTTKDIVGRLGSFLGKGGGYILRVALVLEYLEWADDSSLPEPTEISRKSIGFAGYLFDDYFRPMAERVYGDAASTDEVRAATQVARLIRSEGIEVLNARNLQRRKIPGLKTAVQVDDAIQVLKEHDVIVMKPASEKSGAGRPSSDFTINPNFLKEAL